MNSSLKLPLSFDPVPLRLDLENIRPEEWNRHFNEGYFEGIWDGIALRSANGIVSRIYPDPNASGEVCDTEVLHRCPHLHAVVSSFSCEIRSARLLKLAPRSRIREHRDFNLGFEDGEVRLHIPIATNPGVEFYLNGRRVTMDEGECWYLDFSLPHRVVNNGAADRIHLVLDCTLNNWLRSLLATGEMVETTSNSADKVMYGGWEEFRLFVLEDPVLQQQLREVEDRNVFLEVITDIGRKNGFKFTAEEVADQLRRARRSLNDRWIE